MSLMSGDFQGKLKDWFGVNNIEMLSIASVELGHNSSLKTIYLS